MLIDDTDVGENKNRVATSGQFHICIPPDAHVFLYSEALFKKNHFVLELYCDMVVCYSVGLVFPCVSCRIEEKGVSLYDFLSTCM